MIDFIIITNFINIIFVISTMLIITIIIFTFIIITTIIYTAIIVIVIIITIINRIIRIIMITHRVIIFGVFRIVRTRVDKSIRIRVYRTIRLIIVRIRNITRRVLGIRPNSIRIRAIFELRDIYVIANTVFNIINTMIMDIRTAALQSLLCLVNLPLPERIRLVDFGHPKEFFT